MPDFCVSPHPRLVDLFPIGIRSPAEMKILHLIH
jgi:hypothetical protein